MIEVNLDSLRISLHVLAVSVWVGGQIVMAGLIPVLRGIGGDAPARAARRFARVAWAFFALAAVTGVWNLFEAGLDARETSYHVALSLKLAAVALSGAAAAVHTQTTSPPLRGVTAGVSLLAALGALFLGVLLAG